MCGTGRVDPRLGSADHRACDRYVGVVGVIGHDIRHVLKNLQIVDGERLAILAVGLEGLLQPRQVFEDVALELGAVQPGDGRSGL